MYCGNEKYMIIQHHVYHTSPYIAIEKSFSEHIGSVLKSVLGGLPLSIAVDVRYDTPDMYYKNVFTFNYICFILLHF